MTWLFRILFFEVDIKLYDVICYTDKGGLYADKIKRKI